MNKKFLCFVLSLVLIFSSSVSCFAEEELVTVGSVDIAFIPEFWHYSGGYWKRDPDTETEAIYTDAQLGCAMNLLGELRDNYFKIIVDPPAEALEAYKNGQYITYSLRMTKRPIDNIIDTSSMYVYFEDDKLVVMVIPKLPLAGVKTFDDYIAGLNVTLPLIDYTYGNNLYSIFSGGKNLGVARGGYYCTETKIQLLRPYVHPYYIKDSSGVLRYSYQIQLQNSKIFYPSSHYVGWGTFRDGGAVGFRFVHKFGLDFKAYKEKPTLAENEKGIEAPKTSTPSSWSIHRAK